MVSSMRRSWDVSMGEELRAYISASSRCETRNSSYSLPGFEPAVYLLKQRPDTEHGPQTIRLRISATAEGIHQSNTSSWYLYINPGSPQSIDISERKLTRKG
ncbi:hypothetical protein FHG87_016933 [Trinorchestia longiramus]|nr:hypothetical protein FHG87_016933 [Trinorchestia longiramus]